MIGEPTIHEIRVYGEKLRQLHADALGPAPLRWSDRTLLEQLRARFEIATQHEEDFENKMREHGSYVAYLLREVLAPQVDQKLWNLIVEKESIPGFQNHQYALVVRAPDAKQARKIAYEHVVAQGHRVRFADRWLDPKQVRCVELNLAGPSSVVVMDGLMHGER